GGWVRKAWAGGLGGRGLWGGGGDAGMGIPSVASAPGRGAAAVYPEGAARRRAVLLRPRTQTRGVHRQSPDSTNAAQYSGLVLGRACLPSGSRPVTLPSPRSSLSSPRRASS